MLVFLTFNSRGDHQVCQVVSGSAAVALLAGGAHDVRAQNVWRAVAGGEPVNLAVVNVPFYQGRSLLQLLLKDADLTRNKSVLSHAKGLYAALRGSKRRIDVARNRTVQAVVEELESFLNGLKVSGVEYNCYFGVCTAIECFFDYRQTSFGGNLIQKGAETYGEWKGEIKHNVGHFVTHLQSRGLRVQASPTVDRWFLDAHLAQETDCGRVARTLFPSMFQKFVAAHPNLIWLDVQGLAEDKLVRKAVATAVPNLDVIRLTPKRCDSTSQISYF